MTEPALIGRQRTLLHDLYALIADRAGREPRIESDFRARRDATEQEFHDSTRRVITRFETEKQSSQKEWEETQERVAARFAAERAAQDKEWQEAQQRITAQYETDSKRAKAEYKKLAAEIQATFEAARSKFDTQLAVAKEQTVEAMRKVNRISRELTDLLEDWRQNRDFGPLPTPPKPDRITSDAFRQLLDAMSDAETRLGELQALRLPRLFEGGNLAWVLVPLFAAITGLGALAAYGAEAELIYGLLIGATLAIVVGAGVTLYLYAAAKARIVKVYHPLKQALIDADTACNLARDQAKASHLAQSSNAQKLYDRDFKQATDKHKKQQAFLKERRDTDWNRAEEKYQKDVADSTRRREDDLHAAHDKYQRLRAETYARYESDSHLLHERHFQQTGDNKRRHEQEWDALRADWQQGLARFHAGVAEINRQADDLFPPWDSPFWKTWTPSPAVPPVVRFGDYTVDLAALPQGLSADDRLKPLVPTRYALPALADFPERCSLLLKTPDVGRAQAVRLLQAVMLRYLTAFPAGKVRFTIIDPVGLGENFGGFMHLADYDEALVNNRIWTEMAHIEQRLADLTEHMENVLQKYLRDEYASIEEYNAQAGEVAEPFRILVVANFPSNFSAEAGRRLLSIIGSGVRCGVFTLLTVDPTLEMPQGFSLESLERLTVNLEWQDGRFVWKDEDFERFPLQTDAPPPPEFTKPLLHVVGKKAQEANRVEVPFDFIAPRPEVWWTNTSRGGVDVPLGKAGATKRQHLRLGQGTSQHALVAGKTGSGKSTLLHALITNASLMYSPEELELYLIDFKKGVEFKTYAAHELPHARVVAIESDREFGLSVLQRLDAELRQRGERFREAGAQDLKAYREATGNGAAVPRILLIVDEFQEFFTEDDRVAQEASQLLDRLVRQGRAFGLHVLLGSQTLGGAYTLARSTIDQMAVRIALQCSEADANLILSDGNSAARLLSRPGEAIYNDANGLVEGNNPFQVVWLPEVRREQYLQQVYELDRKRNPDAARPQIVFEGNVLADVSKNAALRRLLTSASWPADARAFHAWLGEAMAIKEPTAAVFRRQTGSNLLVVGQQDDAGLGILATALVGLAAQHPPAGDTARASGARFYVLDASPADSPHAGALGRVARMLPHPVKVGGWRDLPELLGELAGEVESRQKAPEVEGPTLYLFLYCLHRFRDLRKDEDDFGFSGAEERPSPAKQFATLLKEGSGLGIHTLVWCDSYNNAARALDRHMLREFELRVLFQMSANDSGNLIDSPVASRLGPNRAYYHSEEEGRLEKFRPYGLPSEDWLRWAVEQLGRKQVEER